MTKTRKFRLVRLGDAKKLTQGVADTGFELNLKPGRDIG